MSLSPLFPFFPLMPFLLAHTFHLTLYSLLHRFISHLDLDLRDEKIDHEDPHNPTHPPLFSTSQRITFQPGTLRPKDQPTPVSVPAPGHGLNISEPAQGQGTESGLSGTGSGAGGPSTSFTGAVPRPRAGGKRGNKTRRVIEHPDELNTFDLDAMGPHQSGMSMFHLPRPSPSSSHPPSSSSIQPPYHVKEANTTNPFCISPTSRTRPAGDGISRSRSFF